MSAITIEKIDQRLKEIDEEFGKMVRLAAQARDEQIRLRGEFDGLKKMRAELEKKDEPVDAKPAK